MAETIKIGGELESMATGKVVAAASAIKDKVKNKYQGEINAETDATLTNHASAIQGLNSQNYVTVTATDQTTAVTDVLPATGSADTIYRVGSWDGTQYDETCYSEYSWNGSAYVHISTKTQIGEVFDISAYHASGGELAKYADLAAALGTNGASIPQSLRKGGMSVKFVQSSDNNYMQFRYMLQYENTTSGNAAFVNTDNWAVCEDVVQVENSEYLAAFTDSVGHFLLGIKKKDGAIEWAVGVPKPVRAYVNACITEILDGNEGNEIDGLNKVIAFLSDFSTSDTLASLLDTKVDKVEGESLIQTEVSESLSVVESSECIDAEVDIKGRLLGGRLTDGTKVENMPIETPSFKIKHVNSNEWIDAEVDVKNRIFRGVRKDGSTFIAKLDNPQLTNVIKRLEIVEEYGSQEVYVAVNELGNRVDGMEGQVQLNTGSIDALEATVQGLTPVSVDVDITDNIITDWLQAHSIAQTKDDFIAWYYNVPARDVRNTFYNYINSLRSTNDMIAKHISLKQTGDKLSHDASLAVDNVNKVAYVVCTTNPTTSVDNPANGPTRTRLYIVDISGTYRLLDYKDILVPGQTYGSITVASTKTIDGNTRNIGSGCPNIYMTSDGKVHILSNAIVDDSPDDNFRMIHVVYNPANDTFESYTKCNITINDNTLPFTAYEVGGALDIHQSWSFINLNSSMAEKNGYYYAGIGLSSYWTNGVIVRTTDFTNWEYCCIPDYTISCSNDFETALAIKGDYMYVASRQVRQYIPRTGTIASDPRNTLIVAKIALSNYEVIENLYMPDCGARPCFFENGDSLYLLHSIKGRVIGDVVKINTEVLSNSEYIQQILDYVLYPDLKQIDGNNYCYVTTKNGVICIAPLTLMGISQELIDNKFYI